MHRLRLPLCDAHDNDPRPRLILIWYIVVCFLIAFGGLGFSARISFLVEDRFSLQGDSIVIQVVRVILLLVFFVFPFLMVLGAVGAHPCVPMFVCLPRLIWLLAAPNLAACRADFGNGRYFDLGFPRQKHD